MKDLKVAELIQKESNRQENEIELIASENYVSKDVMEATGSCLTNKYSEWYPGKRYYAWNEVIDEVEELAISRAKELFWAEYVNVQPLSGSPANLAVYLGVLNPGDKVLGMSLDQGWHLSHWHPLNFSGILYEIIPYFLDKETELINMDELEKIALETKPKMIIAWFSAYSKDLEWSRFREIADKVWAILFADISHIAGLIAWWIIENPIPYCDIVMTTTHKTLRWPRWAIIMSKEKYAKDIARAVFPWIQGWPHENNIAAKAIAFGEALTDEFLHYQLQVKKNANAMAEALVAKDYHIISGGTDNHMMLIDLRNKNVSGKDAEQALVKADITANKNMVPFDDKSPFITSGIRLGTAAVTTRGLKEADMAAIVELIDEVITNFDNEATLEAVKEKVNVMMKDKPLFV